MARRDWRLFSGGGLLAATLSLSLSLSLSPSAAADTGVTPIRSAPEEPYASGWSFYTDNDYLSAGLSDDEGYTGGFALSLSGRRAAEYPWSLDPLLGWIERAIGWDTQYTGKPSAAQHSWQIGALAFTPGDTDIPTPIRNDRPYAGLIFIGNTRQVRLKRRQVSYLSSFSLGLLGTDVPKAIQDGLHDLTGNDLAQGWDNQISDGGEPTFLWEGQRRQTHWSLRSPEHLDAELNSVLGASVGYSTQVSAGMTGRWGQFTTPWWSFNPAHSEYINLGAPAGAADANELYLWGGVHVRRQFYNAFFEGQFRDSEVTFERPEELDSSLWEINVGGTWGMRNGYHITLALRAVENELPDGRDSEAWGSLIIGRQF